MSVMQTRAHPGKKGVMQYRSLLKGKVEWIDMPQNLSPVGVPEKIPKKKSEDMTVIPDKLPNKESVKNPDSSYDSRKRWAVPAELHERYREKWTEVYGERGCVRLLERLLSFFDQV